MARPAQTIEARTAEYELFPVIPSSLNNIAIDDFLEEQLEIYLAHLSTHVADYIWQSEAFRLSVVQETEFKQAHLIGKTNYGDNVDDEWFIVFLLYQLTKDFPGLVARITDEDGEFLLIEAADHIPRWVDPDSAEKRVYIYNGKLHLIPHQQSSSDNYPQGVPSFRSAVDCIRQNSSQTEASSRVQKDIYARTNQFPDKKYRALHQTHCYLPASLAAVLESSPALVAPIVQAFYLRDPLDLKACVTFQNFRPGTRITRQVKFTRCLYAQLMQQKFQPDRRSGYTLPAVSSPQYKAHDLGTKLAHGAEILCAKCGPLNNDTKQQNLAQKSKNDKRWKRFVHSLDDSGYFRGQLEGSQLYNKLLDDARSYFYTSAGNSNRSDDSPGYRILSQLQSVTFDIEEMRKAERSLPQPDDDTWLDITPKQLDDIMNKAVGKSSASDNFDLQQMSDGLKSFVENVSSHEGAEFPKNDDSEIGFDPNGFIHSMQKMFEFDDDGGKSSSDMSEYGSEDDVSDSLSPSSPQKPLPGRKTTTASSLNVQSPDDVGDFLGMKDYMNMMDHELSSTSVGKSFHKSSDTQKMMNSAPKPPPRRKRRTKSQQSTPESTGDTSIKRPVNKPPPRPTTKPSRPTTKPGTSNDTNGKAKNKAKKSAPKAKWDDIDDLDDDFDPVDVDMNLVKNMLDSYTAQKGMPGPASNMLGEMGVHVPDDAM